MTFDAANSARAMSHDAQSAFVLAEARLVDKAERLQRLVRSRAGYFGQTVMIDGPMDVMLALFIAEQRGTIRELDVLADIYFSDPGNTQALIDNLVLAGLVAVNGANPDRRPVGLTPLGSARMRSFISDHPDI